MTLNVSHNNIQIVFFGEDFTPSLAILIIDIKLTIIYNGVLGTAKSHDTSPAAYTNKHKLYT